MGLDKGAPGAVPKDPASTTPTLGEPVLLDGGAPLVVHAQR